MKKYYELTDSEKDRALDETLNILVKDLVNEVIFIKFKNYHPELEQAISLSRQGDSLKAYSLILSDNIDLRAELLEIAEIAAEDALYSESSDYVVNGVLS